MTLIEAILKDPETFLVWTNGVNLYNTLKFWKNYCFFVNISLHNIQTLVGISSPFSGIIVLNWEHFEQKELPQFLQWCYKI